MKKQKRVRMRQKESEVLESEVSFLFRFASYVKFKYKLCKQTLVGYFLSHRFHKIQNVIIVLQTCFTNWYSVAAGSSRICHDADQSLPGQAG